MSRVPHPLAKRIDRLSRHAHAFHRLAHHPLCNSYRGELVTLGAKRRVCRGCLFAAFGVIIGTTFGLLFSPSLLGEVSLLGAAAALGLASLTLRLPKFVARLLPAAFASAGLTWAVHASFTGDRPSQFIALAGIVLVPGGYVAYRKRGPDRSVCLNCPERTHTEACSGIAPIIRRERAFQRLSQRWLDAAFK